jgi:hypothetical protein
MKTENRVEAAIGDVFASTVSVIDHTDSEIVSHLCELHELLAANFHNYEVLVVDNGMPARELVQIEALLLELPCIRVIRLSQRHSRDAAIFAGLEAAIGDAVVITDIRHDPASDSLAVLDAVVSSPSEVVQGTIATVGAKVPGGRRLGRRAFYWYNRRILGIRMNPSATGMTGLSRRAVNILTSTTRSHRYMVHLLLHIGLPIRDYPYLPTGLRPRHTSSREAIGGAIEMISSYSMQPIRFVTALGALAAIANFVYAVWVITVRVLDENIVEGWATTSLQTSLMFVIICIILVVMAEYLGRVLEESRREPGYSVAEELESKSLISNSSRRNIALD